VANDGVVVREQNSQVSHGTAPPLFWLRRSVAGNPPPVTLELQEIPRVLPAGPNWQHAGITSRQYACLTDRGLQNGGVTEYLSTRQAPTLRPSPRTR